MAELEQKCFIITPNNEKQRESLEGLMISVIEPTLVEIGFQKRNIDVTYRMAEKKPISAKIITRIIEDALCIVNLTGLDPYVMYKLAIRHATSKPVVVLAEEGTNLPFELKDEQTIFYQNTILGEVKLRSSLKDILISIFHLSEYTSSNPILNLLKDQDMIANLRPDKDEEGKMDVLIRKMYDIDQKLTRLLDE
ncbi:hypothetical protein ACIQ34_12045 [Ureibacillus sp. NPDC094379]